MQVNQLQQLLQAHTSHPLTAVPQGGKTAKTEAAASSSTPSSPNTASITANDFLTLLVAEMKNQDPTAQTDPNQYINQLVQVNSLQQLIQINQDLGGNNAPAATSGASAAVATALSRNHAAANPIGAAVAALQAPAKSQS